MPDNGDHRSLVDLVRLAMPQTTAETSGVHSSAVGKLFSWDNLFVLLVGDGIGLSLCIAAGDAALKKDWGPMFAGFGVGLPLMAIATSFPVWKNRVAKWLRDSIVNFAYGGLALLLVAAIVYVLGPYVIPQTKAPSADQIAATVADKLKPLLPPVQPVQARGGFGFAEAQNPPPKHPSKNYSAREKKQLLELIGQITTLFNDKGFPAARNAHGISTNVPTTKDGLDNTFRETDAIETALNEIQKEIWNNILANNATLFGPDLGYIFDNKAKFDNFWRATNQFSGQIVNFQRNLDSFNQSQRNWIASIIQLGSAQTWQRTADDFEAWMRQCGARMDEERKGL